MLIMEEWNAQTESSGNSQAGYPALDDDVPSHWEAVSNKRWTVTEDQFALASEGVFWLLHEQNACAHSPTCPQYIPEMTVNWKRIIYNCESRTPRYCLASPDWLVINSITTSVLVPWTPFLEGEGQFSVKLYSSSPPGRLNQRQQELASVMCEVPKKWLLQPRWLFQIPDGSSWHLLPLKREPVPGPSHRLLLVPVICDYLWFQQLSLGSGFSDGGM